MVIDIFEPAVRLARLRPDPFPIRSCPFAAVDASIPVPPLATGSIPVTSVLPPARLIAEDVMVPFDDECNIPAPYPWNIIPLFCPFLPERTTFPVVELPIDRVCPLVVPSTPRPERVVAIFPEFPEIEAVGVPELTFRNANFDEPVANPPIKRSAVVFLAKIVPFATSNGEFTSPDAHDPHVGVVPPRRH